MFIITIISLAALSAPAQSPKQVEVFGQKINYIEAGAGPNVILLHGLGDDLNVWEQTVPALASKYRVWALDQIGCGQSDKPLINYRVSVLVEFLHARAGRRRGLLAEALRRAGLDP